MSDFLENITPIHFDCVWLGFQLTIIFFSVKKSEGVGSSAGSANNCLFFCPAGNQQSGNTGNTNGQSGAGTGSSTGTGKYCMGILSYAKKSEIADKRHLKYKFAIKICLFISFEIMTFELTHITLVKLMYS